HAPRSMDEPGGLMPTFHEIDVLRHNSASWDAQAARDCEWSRPVSAEEVAAGLLLQDFYEDWQPHPRFVIDRFMPTFLATCALKPRSAAG
ncbi:TPA: hypothetical protein ACGJ3R_004922, partial [Pseudomonas aeruginosa]